MQLLRATLLVALASALLAAQVHASGSFCPASSTDVALFTPQSSWAECDVLDDCQLKFCMCVEGVMDTTAAGFCTGYSQTSAARVQTCATTFANCVLDSALSAAQPACTTLLQPLRAAYDAYKSDESTRPSSNMTTACKANICQLVAASNEAAAEALQYSSVCEFRFASGSGSEEGVPQSPLCPAFGADLVNAPNQCPFYAACERSFCSCINQTYVEGRGCSFRPQLVTEATMAVCAPRYFRCNVNASIANFVTGGDYEESNPCHSFPAKIVGLYSAYYNSGANTSTTELYSQCSGIVCNVVVYAHNHVPQNVPQLCNFSGLPRPPVIRGHTCADQGVNLFDKLPISRCSTVQACISSFCQCGGSTLDTATGDCKATASPTQATLSGCLATTVSCVLNAALNLYVPRSDPANPALSTCARWAIPIAREYSVYFNASANAKTSTPLYTSCNETACNGLLKDFDEKVDLAPVCAFTAVTQTPTYAEPNPFICPDNLTATSLANCTCTQNAMISSADAQFDRAPTGDFTIGNVLTGVAYGTYRVMSGNCSNFDFTPFMRFAWTLQNSSGHVLFNSTGSSLRIPAILLKPGLHTLTLRATGLVAWHTRSMEWQFTAVAPVPTVSITRLGASLRVSTTTRQTITASIVDPYIVAGDSAKFVWLCDVLSGDNLCPSVANSSIVRLTLPTPLPAGTFNITFAYKGIASSLTLTVVAEAIPVVRILATSVPLVASPILYLPTQTVLLGSSITFNGTFTMNWTVNGAPVGNERTLRLPASSLTASTDADLTANTPVPNTITLRVISRANPAIFGEATMVVSVAPTYSVTLGVQKRGDATATTAVGMTDDVALTATTALTTGPYDTAVTRAFGFFADGKFRPLSAVPDGSGASVVQAPMPTGAGAAVDVVFSVSLRLNGIEVALTNSTFSITKPDVAAAAAAQLAQAAAITDPVAAVAAATNMKALMAASEDPAEKAKLAAALVSMLTNAVTDMSSQSKDQQAAIFDTLTTAVTGEQTADEKKELAGKALALVGSALTSGNFDASNGQSALNVLSNVDSKSAAATLDNLATLLAQAPGPLNVVQKLTAGGVTVATVRASASDMSSLSVADDSGASFSVEEGFSLPGVDGDSVVSVGSTSFADNPFEEDGTNELKSKVISYKISVDGSSFPVSGLTTPIRIVLGDVVAGETQECKYWDEAANTWSTSGVDTVQENGKWVCLVYHLTAFGAFGGASSAAGILVSLLAALAIALVNVLLL